jgi:ATP-dependent DNA helicase DinG
VLRGLHPCADAVEVVRVLTPFQTAVAAALGADGPLARAQAGLRPRQGQLDMAQAVARALEADEALVVEAGTGVGKTFAYLVPLLLSGRRALLSTATQALQDQLFARDIPAVSRALGLPVRVALLKGRSSYVCVHRLEQARIGPGAALRRDPAITSGLEQVQRWATGSRSGDLAELPGLDERSVLRPLISPHATTAWVAPARGGRVPRQPRGPRRSRSTGG